MKIFEVCCLCARAYSQDAIGDVEEEVEEELERVGRCVPGDREGE